MENVQDKRIQSIISEMLAMKAMGTENDTIPRNALLDAFISNELQVIKKAADGMTGELKPWAQLDQLFLSALYDRD